MTPLFFSSVEPALVLFGGQTRKLTVLRANGSVCTDHNIKALGPAMTEFRSYIIGAKLTSSDDTFFFCGQSTKNCKQIFVLFAIAYLERLKLFPCCLRMTMTVYDLHSFRWKYVLQMLQV